MKKYLLVMMSVFALISCSKDGNDPNAGLETISENSVLKYSGNFSATSGNSVSGSSKIYLEGTTYKLKLESFSVTTGPDLKVYLSKADTPTEFINLGSLGTGNNLVYNIPPSVDFTQYKYVLIHCQQYNHLFAVSNLMMN